MSWFAEAAGSRGDIPPIKAPLMQERMAGEGIDPAGGPPEQFRDVLKRDVPKWQKVVKDANIKAIQ